MIEHRKIKLSDKRQRWVGTRTTVMRGLPLQYNAGVQQEYYSSIYKYFKRMVSKTKEVVEKLFKSHSSKAFFKQQALISAVDSKENLSVKADRAMNELRITFSKLFRDNSLDLANEMLDSSLKISEINLGHSLKDLTGGVTLKTSGIPKGLETISKSVVKENVSLIKSIPDEYLSHVSEAVMRSITTGNGYPNLIKEISKYSSRTQRHIRNTAYDQTRKAYNSINQQRMMAVGVKKFRWLHSGGGQQPRKDHIAMDGNIYSFDNLPVIEKKTGERGIPGQAINCKCTMEPVIEFEDGTQI